MKSRRHREIDPAIWTSDEDFINLSDQAKLLFIYLLTCPAIVYTPAIYRLAPSTVVSDLNWSRRKLFRAYRELHGGGFAANTEGGWRHSQVIAIPRSTSFRAPKNRDQAVLWLKMAREVPPCDSRNEFIQWVMKRIEEFEHKTETETETETDTKQKQKGQKKAEKGDLLFEAFWSEYPPVGSPPRRAGKEPARKAWKKIKPEIATVDDVIMPALRTQKQVLWKDKDPKYIPHASKWLNQKLFLDEIVEPRKGEFL